MKFILICGFASKIRDKFMNMMSTWVSELMMWWMLCDWFKYDHQKRVAYIINLINVYANVVCLFIR